MEPQVNLDEFMNDQLDRVLDRLNTFEDSHTQRRMVDARDDRPTIAEMAVETRGLCRTNAMGQMGARRPK